MDFETSWRKLGVISRMFARLGALALFAMMMLTTTDVVCRYALNSPIIGAFEITEFLVLILIFSFIGFTQSQNGHIAVDILFTRFPKRVQLVVGFVNHLVCLLLMGLIAWMGVMTGLELWEVGEKSSNLHIPKYPFAFFLALGCVVACIEYVRDLMELAMSSKEREE